MLEPKQRRAIDVDAYGFGLLTTHIARHQAQRVNRLAAKFGRSAMKIGGYPNFLASAIVRPLRAWVMSRCEEVRRQRSAV